MYVVINYMLFFNFLIKLILKKCNLSGILNKCLLLLIPFMGVQHWRRFSRKNKIFYKKFCVYEQAKDFIDEKLVLKKEKSVSYFFRYVRSQYIICTLFLFHRYILFFDKTHFYFINFYFRETNLFATLLPHYEDRVLHRKGHITFLSAG